MSEYAVQEGVFEIPDGFADRTINTFILGTPGSSTFNLSLSRDTTFSDETIDAYVVRQLAVLKKNIKGYKLLHQQSARLGRKIDGIEIYGSWKEGAQIIYQRQAAFLVDINNALIFSATSGKAFDALTDGYWQSWLASYRTHHS